MRNRKPKILDLPEEKEAKSKIREGFFRVPIQLNVNH